MLYHDLCHVVGRNIAAAACNQLFENNCNPDSYVDHQSHLTFPLTWDGRGYDVEFIQAFTNFILSKGVAVLGGNDNDPEPHPLICGSRIVRVPLPRDISPDEKAAQIVVRYDPDYKYWTMFNRKTGAKVRFSLDLENAEPLTIEKAFAPELVDIKVTNFCDKGCSFCYQQSTARDSRDLPAGFEHLVHALKDLKVFEVALGGGEITKMPSFHKIIDSVCRNGIVPNFSTASLDWLYHREVKERVLDRIGGFAYSVQDHFLSEVQKLHQAIKDAGSYHCPVTIQTIVGLPGTWWNGCTKFYTDICKQYGFGLTLLGYKQVGRAKNTRPSRVNWTKEWEYLAQAGIPISIDTVLAKRFAKSLKAAGVPDTLFTKEEGRFSCYINATTMKMGPSSFCPENQMVQLQTPGWKHDGSEEVPSYSQQILGHFKRW